MSLFSILLSCLVLCPLKAEEKPFASDSLSKEENKVSLQKNHEDPETFIQNHIDKNRGVSFVYGEGPVLCVSFDSPVCDLCRVAYKDLTQKIINKDLKFSVLFVMHPKDLENFKINMMLKKVQDMAQGQWASNAFRVLLETQSWPKNGAAEFATSIILQSLKDQGMDLKTYQTIEESLHALNKAYKNSKNLDQLKKDSLAQDIFNAYAQNREQFKIDGVPSLFLNVNGQFEKATSLEKVLLKEQDAQTKEKLGNSSLEQKSEEQKKESENASADKEAEEKSQAPKAQEEPVKPEDEKKIEPTESTRADSEGAQADEKKPDDANVEDQNADAQK